jgi:hypothetical protein
MPDLSAAHLDRRRFMVLVAAFGADLPLLAAGTERSGSMTIDGAIEIEDSRWIEALLRHLST